MKTSGEISSTATHDIGWFDEAQGKGLLTATEL